MIQPSKSAKDIFLMGLDVAPSGRAALMDVECGGDVALRRQVESLLKVHDEPDSLLDSPRIDVGVASVARSEDSRTIAEKVGTQIGPYRLLQQIGEGGFGVVFMAEQSHPVRRKVALKIVKPGMDTPQVIARFEAERQALALMEHPHIAKVLDAGTTDSPLDGANDALVALGRPYFVMELVHGRPITEFCDDNKLTTRGRLELFVDVCRAVQHAHQKGIIHRDLKPSNVLITMDGDIAMPKVIDFGIAKAVDQQLTEKHLFTMYGQMVGTPLYMSPEQAQLNAIDVDTRSDVYSLGVLLYELLTGTTPFDKATLQKSGFDEMRRIIRDDDPPRPSVRVSTLNAEQSSTVSEKRQIDSRQFYDLLRGELDWVVIKAMEKDRAQRYQSASALAEDVRRYLDGDPVDAHPPSTLYRLGKFSRRHYAWLTFASLIAVTLVAGIAATMWQAIRANNAERNLQHQLQRAVAGEQQALEQASLAEKAANVAVRRNDAEAEALVRAVLEDQEQRLGKNHISTISSLNRLALLLDRQQRHEDAEPLYHAAIERCQRLERASQADALALDIHENLATNLNDQARYAEVEAIWRRLATSYTQTLGSKHEKTIDALSFVGIALANQFKYTDAIEVYRRVLQQEQAGPNRPEMIKAYGWAIAQCKRKTELSLADHYFERGVGSAKLARWRLALADFKGAMRLEPDDPTHWFVVALASIHAKELSDYREHCDELLRDTPQFSDPDRVARIVDSLLLHQESSQDWRAVASLFDPYLNGRDGRASLRVRYGALLYRAGDYEQAIQRLKKLTDSDETDAVAKIWLTLSLARAHRVDEARQLLANGVKGLRRKWLTAPWYIRLRDQYLLTEVPAELWDGPSPFDREE